MKRLRIRKITCAAALAVLTVLLAEPAAARFEAYAATGRGAAGPGETGYVGLKEAMARRDLYPAWDRDRDGMLSQIEFDRSLIVYDLRPVDGLFASYDRDHDGAIGPAEWQAFKKAIVD